MSTNWIVPRDWVGETVAILASGPSMSREMADYVRGKCRVIAVNNQGIDTVDTATGALVPAFAPWADVLYASDAKWWLQYADRARSFTGTKVTARHGLVPWPEVFSLAVSVRVPYDPSPEHIVTGGNSGYAALHLAIQRGASRVLLCGYDMQEVRGKRHWFGTHEGKLENEQRYSGWIANFERLSLALKPMGVSVINCTPGGRLTGFKKAKLEETL
jgi:hypothetical protein